MPVTTTMRYAGNCQLTPVESRCSQTYRHHEASREAIEIAFDRVLSEHMKKRKKFGFRAAKLGRKTGTLQDDVPTKSFMQRFLDLFEPSVPLTTIVNDGVIYLLLSFWAAGTQYATQDPTGPFVVTIGSSIFSFVCRDIAPS